MSSKYPYIAHSKINILSAASFAIVQTIKDWLISTQLSLIKKLTNATIKQLVCSAEMILWSPVLSINRSVNLFVQKCNKHWTGHQGRMQPPLTGAHENNVSKSNK